LDQDWLMRPSLKRLAAELAAVTADETISVAQARMPAAWAQALVILGKATHRMSGAQREM
jgi:hypothetical protein